MHQNILELSASNTQYQTSDMSQHEHKSQNRSMSQEETKRIMRNGSILAGLSVVFMTIMTLLVHFDAIRLYPSNVNAEIIKGYAGRVEFTLRYQTLLVFWLMINVITTIYGRLSTMAINPLDDRSEPKVQGHKNILTNSFEQIFLSVFAQLIFASFAAPECILKTIPLVNIIQFIGRVTFFAGYPLKRSFGFLCTWIPTFFLILYNMYKFMSFLGLY